MPRIQVFGLGNGRTLSELQMLMETIAITIVHDELASFRIDKICAFKIEIEKLWIATSMAQTSNRANGSRGFDKYKFINPGL